MIWFSNSDSGMVLYLDNAAMCDLIGIQEVTRDDKKVFVIADADDNPVLSRDRHTTSWTEFKASWHSQNEYWQINLNVWSTGHGRKKRSIVQSSFEDDALTVVLPKVQADAAALVSAVNKLNSIIDDSSMVLSVKDNRIQIAISMIIGG